MEARNADRRVDTRRRDDDDMHDVMRALGNIEGTLASVRGEQIRHAQQMLRIEERISRLEIHRSQSVGYGAGAGAMAAVLFTVAKALFGA